MTAHKPIEGKEKPPARAPARAPARPHAAAKPPVADAPKGYTEARDKTYGITAAREKKAAEAAKKPE